MKTHTMLIPVALALLVPLSAHGGVILLPGQLVDDAFVAADPDNSTAYSIRYSSITTNIRGELAETKIQETVVGPEAAIQAVCLAPLPIGVEGASLSFTIDETPLSNAKFLKADAAQRIYESAAKGLGDVRILALTGQPAILVPQIELSGRMEVSIQFKQQVETRSGIRSFRCPTPAAQWASGTVARMSVTARVSDELPVRAMFSPTHEAEIEREDLHHAAARVRLDNWAGEDDFRLCWVADRDELGLRALAYRDPEDTEGYFMLLGNPTGSEDHETVIAKDVVFVLDTSGSMRGEKIEQSRAAVEYCLDRLNPGDRFNIITFGTEVASFCDGLVNSTPKRQADAQAFIEEIVAQGRTNISGALETALANNAKADRPHITIFLTDGTPTAGELVPEKIVEGITQAGPISTRIFVMGVGHDVNAHLLDKLAEATDGSSEYVTEEDEIDAKIAALYDRLSYPVLTDVLVDCGGLRTNSIYPKKLPALFKGSEFMLFGRYRGGGKHTFTVSGNLAGEPTEYACTIELPTEPTDEANAFVAPLWAARKIGFLLQEIRLHGENDELIAEVVRLSKQFGIVTEYTEFLAMASSDVSTAVAVDEARRRLNVANAVQAGQWAFNQARNDLNLQQKVVASQGANFYLDRQGRRVATERIQQFDDNVFYLRDGQWVDAQETGERKVRKVELFSEEYNELVRNNPRFARSQRLGWAMSINVGGERIVVEKDGQTQNEELQAMDQSQTPSDMQRGVNQWQQMRNDIQLNNAVPRNLNQMDRQQRIQIPAQQMQQFPLNQIPNLNFNGR